MNEPVLYIVGTYPSRTETFIAAEVRGLRERAMAIDICPVATLRPATGIAAIGRVRGALPAWRGMRSCTDACTVRRAAGALLRAAIVASRRTRPRHIHAHFLGLPATVACCVSKMLGIPYSVTAHARDIYAESTPAVVVSEARFLTTCTQTNMEFLRRRYPGARLELVRHGLDFRGVPCADSRSAGKRRGMKCCILAVGRFVEKKGFRYLIDACAEMRADGFAFRCTLVGDGPEKRRLLRRIQALDLTDEVFILPSCGQQELMGHYNRADVLVAPSIVADDGDRDGIPNVILEAMAHGVPVIASDAGSIPEAVAEGETGLAIPQRDAPAIGAAVVRLWEDAALSDRLTRGALSLVAGEFSQDKWLDKLHSLFNT